METIVSESVELEVPFNDLDPMNIAWHGNYFRYFEMARGAVLRKIGYDYPDMYASGYLWPVVKANVKYVRSATYAQRLRVTAAIVEWENRLRIRYRVEDAVSGEKLTTGETIQCAVDAEREEMQLVSPPVLKERLAPWL